MHAIARIPLDKDTERVADRVGIEPGAGAGDGGGEAVGFSVNSLCFESPWSRTGIPINAANGVERVANAMVSINIAGEGTGITVGTGALGGSCMKRKPSNAADGDARIDAGRGIGADECGERRIGYTEQSPGLGTAGA